MGTLAAASVFQTKLETSSFLNGTTRRGFMTKKKQPIFPVARLIFGPAIFEESKLKVLFLGADEEKSTTTPRKLPRTYTLTHCDITSNLTLAISHTINNSQLQGWYKRFQRNEVVAEWKKIKGKMSLHVHCHISGDHLWLNLCAALRYYIFSKELPVVLKAFASGDENLFNSYPELKESLVWVYFHSHISRFNKTECWGPFKESWAASGGPIGPNGELNGENETSLSPQICVEKCTCCFPAMSLNSLGPKLADSYMSKISN
ncbi:protein STAY-GREEN homolog, chloroplastic-like isoform X2 [Henckelia pumila]|uniref:protein STAY-GREEN homolog, chloroplastic-like isoform X2 n=1 Tax=Henckelia pumila TaxID=405737 RepID=UPI003C6DEFCB